MNSTTIFSTSEKTYLLAHQNVCITSIDFIEKKLAGYTELHFVPLKLNKVSKVRLNAKQCQIVKLLAKGSTNYQDCTFTFNDPLLEVVPVESQAEGEIHAPDRTLKKFSSKHQDAVESTELDLGNGELIITLPDLVQKEISDGSTFKIFIEYMIERPSGGLHFVTPKEENQDKPPDVDLASSLRNQVVTNASSSTPTISTTAVEADNSATSVSTPSAAATSSQEHVPRSPRPNETNGVSPRDSPGSKDGSEGDSRTDNQETLKKIKKVEHIRTGSKFAHLFTYKNHNSSRLWFPCLDSFDQPCTWLLEFTVESHLTVVSCGESIGTCTTLDKRFKTYRFELNIPTSAPNMDFACGQFETWTNPGSVNTNCRITKNYYLSGLDKLAEASCAFRTADCAEFYVDYLTFKYPHSYYRQVFVDQA